jgi:hypothetical protein
MRTGLTEADGACQAARSEVRRRRWRGRAPHRLDLCLARRIYFVVALPNKAMKLTRLAAAPGRMRQGAAAWPRWQGAAATASQLIAGVLRTQCEVADA